MQNFIYPKGSGEIFPLLARTATITSDAFTNNGARGLHVVVDVTAAADTPSIVPTIQAFDVASGKWYDLLVGTAITGVSTNVFRLYPGITAAAGASVSDALPIVFRVKVTHADTDSITYSVGFSPLA
jgi:hypothetical protein